MFFTLKKDLKVLDVLHIFREKKGCCYRCKGYKRERKTSKGDYINLIPNVIIQLLILTLSFEGKYLSYVGIHGYKPTVYSIHTWSWVNWKLKVIIQEVSILREEKRDG